MGEPTYQNRDIDDYINRGNLPAGNNNFGDAARDELFHVHAKPGDIVFINKDDPRSADIIRHDEGGKFVAVHERDFLRFGGRIGRDQFNNPYPPYAWQSHPEVPTWEQSQGGMRLPPRNQPRVEIDVDINGVRRSGGFENDGHIHSAGCGCNRNTNRNRDGSLRYPHQRDRDDEWYGTPPIIPDHRFPSGRPRYPGGGFPGGGHHGGSGVEIIFGNKDFSIGVDIGNMINRHQRNNRMQYPHQRR